MTERLIREAPLEEEKRISYENVAVSTRVRLARNFAEYPFPNRMNTDEAEEIIQLVAAAMNSVESFKLYYMKAISEERAALLKKRKLISRDLIKNRPISAALISEDESISVMVNEEDHLREQYFMKGYDLRKAYERIAGLDEILSESIAFAFDKQLGYLTSCPTNLGTGLRASVMLFLPALVRRRRMRGIIAQLKRLGLAVRGGFGEGSGFEGDLFQISNEVTLGPPEEEILSVVEEAVNAVVAAELTERECMLEEGWVSLADEILRAYGVLTNCLTIGDKEFLRLMSDVKLGVVLGFFEGSMEALDDLIIDLRPANIDLLNGAPLSEPERDVYRAEYAGKALRGMGLLTEKKRNDLSPRG